ncbi:PREDICTED: vomeronasal type-1 receptor 1 [Miniopterus natalensis]|uniref:vomeronasal type-1 receptor 1 n=1 Tax=Miniopterus natalensis TaxID=291302 RepID=UPI0007A6C331|nr:PREDICTED: vomeronasal type-1 receptor 1 [Miniopterus natalensis]
MPSSGSETGIMLLTQTGIGLLGNISLLCLCNSTLLTGHNVKPTNLILMQLVSANFLILFSGGIPHTMAAFGWKYFLDDTGCKCIFYFHSVAIGVSFSTICLYYGFQVIKLNPSIWRWMELKFRSRKFISFCCFLCWILQLLINSCVLILTNGPLNGNYRSVKNNSGFCSWNIQESLVGSLTVVIYFFPHFMSLGFLIWAGSFLVLFLHRHKQRVQRICSSRLSPRPPYEARATRSILVLMSSFVMFYSAYIIVIIWVTLAAQRSLWVLNSFVFMEPSFPTLFPFVLISSNTRASQLCLACRARKSVS